MNNGRSCVTGDRDRRAHDHDDMISVNEDKQSGRVPSRNILIAYKHEGQ